MEVVVVGAGAVGCAVAARLAEAGRMVLLVDRTGAGAEASSAAAGILASQVEAHADGAFFRLLWQSERRWEAFSRELEERTGLAVAYLPSGAL
ncbi:MAG: FAD-dependent oxidoreductase, partial [Deltaproteobacteria bacterium]